MTVLNLNLDSAASHLCPGSSVGSGTLMASPSLALSIASGQLPLQLDPDQCLLSSEDPVTGIRWPFVAGPTTLATLRVFGRGPWPRNRATRNLELAGILQQQTSGTPTPNSHAVEQGTTDIQFSRGILPPFLIGALREYYRETQLEGGLRHGDRQCAARSIAHNEPVAAFLHAFFLRYVESLAEASLKPSYSYVAAYGPGSSLPAHTDREQCEWTLSVCVDRCPDERDWSWPLRVQVRRSWLEYDLAVGDGLLFKGRKLKHARRSIPDGCSATFIMLHYVPKTFAGSLK